MDTTPDNNRMNALEPAALVSANTLHPPAGFEAFWLDLAGPRAPAFLTRFDLLTTLDEDVRKKLEKIPLFKAVTHAILRPRTAFAGSTVSEYALYPDLPDFKVLLDALRQAGRSRGARFMIVKDVPQESPLLSAVENAAAARLLDACRANGFTVLEGQALAYVPLDFKSEDEYLARFSGKRRYDFRRKLKKRGDVRHEEIPTGDPRFNDDAMVDGLYAMYEGVFAQSEIHFDKLSRDFFASVFRDTSSGGIVFFYHVAGKLAGWKLCFVCNGNFVDKYIGFTYPDAREANLYFLSWFHCLDFALRHGLKNYVVGWTDATVKGYLGAKFTFTRHAVYLSNPLYRIILNRCQRFFEPDRKLVAEESGLAPET